MVIDAHQHFWQIDRGDYSWMDDSVAAIRKDYLPRDMVHHAHACGVTGTVVVQAAPTVDETLFLLQLADQPPDVLITAEGHGAQAQFGYEQPRVAQRLVAWTIVSIEQW